MNAASVIRIEQNVDRAASALLALASGYAAQLWFASTLHQPMLAAASVAAAAFAFLVSSRALGAVQPRPRRLPVSIFDVREMEPMDGEQSIASDRPAQRDRSELLLTDRLEAVAQSLEEPLLLEDILARIEPDSRVVRLFDPAAMPTAGELRSRIDRHLDHDRSKAQTNEAAQALHDALAELRRSLR